MPLYEYECEACGSRFEVIQRFSDNPIEACRQCGGPVHKLISPSALQFKGTGWYITDYAKKHAASSPSPSSQASGSSGESKSDGASSTAAPAAASASDKKD